MTEAAQIPRTYGGVRLLLVALSLALVAGCSGSSTPAAHSAAPSAPASPAASSPSAAATSASTPGAAAGQKPVPAENNPPGDIPDNVAYVPYANAAGKYSFTHPEGWAETTSGTSVTFTDKLNGVQGTVGSRTSAPTVDSAKAEDIPALKQSQAAFELRGVTAVTEPGGTGVRIVYRRNSAPDAVTGRQYRDEVERYELVSHGREVIVELFGPVGADNVDAYRTMITSLKIR